MTSKQQIAIRLNDFRRRDLSNETIYIILLSLVAITFLFTTALIFFIPYLILLATIPLVVLGIRNLLVKYPLNRIAKRIETSFPELKGYLVNAVELSQYQQNSKEGYSFELIDAVINEAAKRLAPISTTRIIERKKTKKAFGAFIAIVLMLGLYIIIFPNRTKLGLYAVFAPAQTPIQFVVTPGNIRVEKASKVSLNLKIDSPYHFNQATLIKKTENNKLSKKRIPIKNQSGSIDIIVDKEFDYTFRVFNKNSPTYRIGLLKPLTITLLSFKYIFPSYTRLEPIVSQAQEISVLSGTKLEISGTAENHLSAGQLLFDDSTIINLSLAENRFYGNFTAHKDASFELRLKDISGNHNEREKYRINIMPDEYPFVKIFQPGRNIDLPVRMKILLGINTLDDYGLENLTLYYGKDSLINKTHLKNLRSRLEDTTYYYWDLSSIGFLPGEAIDYYVTVLDNDAISGPKASRSEIYTIRFPTMAEIYSQTTNQTAETMERLEPLADEQEQLRQEMERIDQELKKERKLGWEEKRSLENLVSNQEKLLEQIEDLKQEVKNALENMFQGLMLDKESLEKLKELETLLAELLPKELKEALKNLRQALETQSPETKQAMERFKLSQEELKKAIERAVELLKNIQEEEKLKALANKAEALYEAQKELNTKFNEDLQKLAKDEAKIKEELESLEKETEALSKEINDKELAEDLSKLVNELSEMKPSAQAAEAAQNMKQNQKDQAQRKSQKLMKDLEKLKNSFSALVEKLKDKRSQEIGEKLLNSARDLVALSQEQERLENIANKSQNLSELAGAQKRLEEASQAIAESLASLSKKSIKIPPNLGEDIIRSLLHMDEAANNLQNSNLNGAKQMMAQARSGLDAATEKILNTLSQAQKGGGFGSGFESLLEQLSQLTAEQMMLNQELGGMLPIPVPGGLTAQQLAQIERILSKQRQIRQALEQMQQNLGVEPGLMSSLDGVIEEMKQVERDLSQLVVSRELIERQEKILNRLLDTQRSVRRREFKEKREREIGKDYPIPPSPTLPADLGERKKLLREKLMQALKEGYPKDYERLIKLYFESLLNE